MKEWWGRGVKVFTLVEIADHMYVSVERGKSIFVSIVISIRYIYIDKHIQIHINQFLNKPQQNVFTPV